MIGVADFWPLRLNHPVGDHDDWFASRVVLSLVFLYFVLWSMI